MVRNPFNKADSGSSFVCFIFAGLVIQAIYFFIFIDTAYLKDHTITLEKIAMKRGYDDMEEVPYNDPLNHEGDIIKTDKLWILAIVFYFFSMMWFISYFQLIFTDIGVKESGEQEG